MGVNELWSILEPVRESVPLHSLSGKTLAVDLSLWVCEAQAVRGMMGKVTKPHLRNLFFRVSCLTLMGIKLIFVMEGEAPKLKADTMSKRNAVKYGTSGKATTRPGKTGRSHFKFLLKECAELLDCLGVPWVTAAGEAEAMCAYLNVHGYVDGCITNDGDVFLYGGQTVYRNFNTNTKDPQLDCYRVSRIKSELGLERETLVGLAILLGCDYLPKGIPGVGKEQSMKLIETLKGETLLQRFKQWTDEFQDFKTSEKAAEKVTHCQVCHHPGSAKDHGRNGCKLCNSKQFCEPQDYDYCCPCDWHLAEGERQTNAAEISVKRKARVCEGFPFNEVIREFLISKDKPIKNIRWRKPNLFLMQNLAWDKMEWPKPYTCERVLIMMTYTEMKNKKLAKESTTQIKPVRIFKSRVRNGVPCFEVIWHKPEHYTFKDDHPADAQNTVNTIEEESLFQAAYPEIVDLYLKEKAKTEENKQKNKKRKPKAQKSANTDDVADLLAQMTIQPSIKETSELGTNAEGEQHLNDSEEQEDDLRTFHCLSVLHNSSITITSKETLCDNPTIVTEAKKTENKETAHSLSPVSSNKQHSLTTSSPALIEELQLSGIDWGATSFGTASKEQHSLTASSPSALIEELQLSGIDWGATSFGTSPSAPVHKTLSATSKQGDSLTPLQSSKDNECTKSLVHSTEKGEELTFCSGTMDHNSLCIDLKEHSSNPAANLPYSQFSLRDRILLKNFNHSSTSQHRNNDVVSVSLKPLKYLTPVEQKNECPAVEKAPLSKPSVVESQNFKGQKSVKEKLTGQKSCSKQVEKHASVKTSTHLVKHEGGEKKQHQKVFQSKTVENQHHVKSTNQSKISSLPLSHKCDVPVNHTLVVAKNIKKSVIKKSVCHNLCSSSEDSDAENTSSIVQKHQAQSKTKQRCVSSSDEKIKTTKMASKLCAKKAFSHIEAPLSSKRYLGQIANSQTQKNEKLLTTNAKPSVEIEKEKQRFPSGVNHCGIANCSQSPVHSSESRDSEGDDSIISLDSPLPLSERIKLRFQN
ncbi:flap endonuclease GEN homolog 1 isoform X1 [Acipenser ruthenus]|uniref:flap endonuclease GEN homolog 1 isoform X1 n=2 Tax=Acipenser ruthenus TaxID=7906 RepID=UPI00155FCD38|nr:flap endonuclease GEN homolog 1 isoform X1 [Acipenser ruthenus]XP_058879715.1 flap endonuclease GEN homolog 1 isoform X1 [Acipenser ruthenus]